ncbi:MAG: methyltransferase [Phaeodactylibacter sp.]|nr:methyltransferase [Phaeodactylibacter sp.]MCB9050673.1 methyltransferase [Lewinellaceae bacterium]
MTMPEKKAEPFRFKQFSIQQDRCTMKVGTDGVLLGAWAKVDGAAQILDIGTGSGLIAIMLAQRAEQAEIHAVEVDRQAAEQARENMNVSPWPGRLKVFNTSVQEYVHAASTRYELIVSNPPFFSGGTFSHNQDRNSVRHTIKLPHGDLLSAVRNLLAPNGRFSLILPYIEGLRFQELAKNYHLYCTRVTEVMPKHNKPVERLLMEFERQASAVEKSSLVIQHQNRNDWTDDYVKLAGAFYLKM